MKYRGSNHQEAKGMNMTDQLRKAIKQSKQSLYRVAKGAGISYAVVFHFVKGKRQDIRLSTVQALCDYLGLELTGKGGGKHGR